MNLWDDAYQTYLMLFYFFTFLPSTDDINLIVVYTGAGLRDLFSELQQDSASENYKVLASLHGWSWTWNSCGNAELRGRVSDAGLMYVWRNPGWYCRVSCGQQGRHRARVTSASSGRRAQYYPPACVIVQQCVKCSDKRWQPPGQPGTADLLRFMISYYEI